MTLLVCQKYLLQASDDKQSKLKRMNACPHKDICSGGTADIRFVAHQFPSRLCIVKVVLVTMILAGSRDKLDAGLLLEICCVLIVDASLQQLELRSQLVYFLTNAG